MIRLAVGRPPLLTPSSDWTDASDTWGAGRNKLALHESINAHAPRYARLDRHLTDGSISAPPPRHPSHPGPFLRTGRAADNALMGCGGRLKAGSKVCEAVMQSCFSETGRLSLEAPAHITLLGDSINTEPPGTCHPRLPASNGTHGEFASPENRCTVGQLEGPSLSRGPPQTQRKHSSAVICFQ
ncbi:hypothetical protein JOQ06_018159, partial [Pogonophryne albipinna]